MENATKALLIAAAVLIAILIISFALIIYNMAAETVGNVNLSEAEIAQFNAKFTAFEADKVSGERLKTIFNVVIAHNQQEKEAGTNRFVKLVNHNNAAHVNEDTDYIYQMPPPSYEFKIVCEYKDGLVYQIKAIRIK